MGIKKDKPIKSKSKEVEEEKSSNPFKRLAKLSKTVSSIYDKKRQDSPNNLSDDIEEPKKDNIDVFQAEKHAKIFGYTPDWSNNYFIRRLMAKL